MGSESHLEPEEFSYLVHGKQRQKGIISCFPVNLLDPN